jgi:signal transduction histidine kinase/ligand-binding sensor domain-containing protein
VLCAIERGQTQCFDTDGPSANVIGLFEDRRGTLWAGAVDGIWQWRPGPRRFYQLSPQPNGFRAFAESDDGELLIATAAGIRRFRDGRAELTYPFPRQLHDLGAGSLLRDRDGGLWIGTRAKGLVHVHQGATDVFALADGLSDDGVAAIFEDRESNVWVVTEEGLDRFRDPPVASVSMRQGLSNSRVQSVLGARDGSVWVGTSDGLNHIAGGVSGDVRHVAIRSLPEGIVASMFEDSLGRVWVSTRPSVGYLDGDHFVAVRGLPGGVTRAIAEDSSSVWVANHDAGLFGVSPDGNIIRQLPWAALNPKAPAIAMVADRSRAGLWLGFPEAGLINVVDGQIRASFDTSNGLGQGAVHHLHFDREGVLWASTNGGLSRVHNGRVTTLTRKNGLPCDAAQWVVDDPQSFWVATSCGLARIARAELDRWASAAESDRTETPGVAATVFGNVDGVKLYVGATQYSSPAAAAADGRVWFVSRDGVSVVDPRRLTSNTLPPPVHIEQITVDRKAYDAGSNGTIALRLPSLTRDVQIDYTALSLVAPENIRFRYKLEGHDREWQDAGNRRQAFFNDLAPKAYRFRVVASNNSGVWNETGAAVDFSIAPAYYQSTWFLALSAGIVLGLVWTAHRVRLRIVEKHQHEISALNERLMGAQEQERIRIAGELHDGVMQQMLAATMMVGTAKRRLDEPVQARATLDKIQEKLVEAGADIRQLSHDLHPPLLQDAGLPKALQASCEQFSAASGIPVSCDCDESARDLSRGAALALFRIVQEALGNAAKHAHPTRIAVRLSRSGEVVSLSVADDGVGFDPSRLGTSGGLGLVMMRERASQLNGTFEFESAPGRGTTIKVVIPFR